MREKILGSAFMCSRVVRAGFSLDNRPKPGLGWVDSTYEMSYLVVYYIYDILYRLYTPLYLGSIHPCSMLYTLLLLLPLYEWVVTLQIPHSTARSGVSRGLPPSYIWMWGWCSALFYHSSSKSSLARYLVHPCRYIHHITISCIYPSILILYYTISCGVSHFAPAAPRCSYYIL